MCPSFYTRRIQLTSECWVRLNNAIKEKTLMSSNVKYLAEAEAKRRTFHETNES